MSAPRWFYVLRAGLAGALSATVIGCMGGMMSARAISANAFERQLASPGEESAAIASEVVAISGRLKIKFAQRRSDTIAEPRAATIEHRVTIPGDPSRGDRSFVFLIQLQAEPTGNANELRIVPRIFAECVRQHRSIVWTDEESDHDFLQLLEEVRDVIDDRG